MKATFALLTDQGLHNHMRRLAFELNRDCGVDFFGAQLPPHISLKQPFPIMEPGEVEGYFDGFAARTAPVDIRIKGLYLYPGDVPTGIFCDVVETRELRLLHEGLNAELSERFGSTEALFDGDAYHFHATIGLGHSPRPEAYHEFLAKVGSGFDYSFTAKEIVMFYYDSNDYRIGSFMTYKVLPLAGKGGDGL